MTTRTTNDISPVTLEMHQAGKGDLLRIVGDGGSVIIDSGTAECAPTLRRLLADKRCELLVLTHLDADHFGGLQQLLQEYFRGQANDVSWPQEVVVNDFEPRDAVESVRAVLGADGPTDFDSLIAQAREWQQGARESTKVAIRGDGDRKSRIGGVIPALVEVDDAAFAYLATFSSSPKWPWPDFYALREIDELAHAYGDRDLIDMIHDLLFRLDRERGDERLRDERFALDGGAVAVVRRTHTRQPGISVSINDNSLLDGTTSDIPAGLPAPVRGLLHLARRGPQILESVKTASNTITLIEALRKIIGKDKVTFAQVEHRPRITALRDALTLHIVGPDEPELQGLRKKWNEIRQRGQIHMRAQHTMFLEASLFAADAGRFRMDTSVTNRSSIQFVADTLRGRAILTGDGRPDTLERTIKKLSSLPSRHCHVFKAAHHGSDHNIDLRQDPNTVLNQFQPSEIWVSGDDTTHPAREFLRYLHEQREHVKFEIAVTNANENVRAMQSRLPIRVMKDDQPFTRDLNSPA